MRGYSAASLVVIDEAARVCTLMDNSFQSARPRGGATSTLLLARVCAMVSIHAPPWGATKGYSVAVVQRRRFEISLKPRLVLSQVVPLAQRFTPARRSKSRCKFFALSGHRVQMDIK